MDSPTSGGCLWCRHDDPAITPATAPLLSGGFLSSPRLIQESCAELGLTIANSVAPARMPSTFI
jgi:hypothetical protein